MTTQDESPAVPEARTGHIHQLIDQRRAAKRDAQQARLLLGNLPPSRPAGDESQYRNDADWRNAVVTVPDVHSEWKRIGAQAIKTVAENDPATFLRVVAGLVAKDVSGEGLGPIKIVLMSGDELA
jgi:hypothetical protein